MTVDDQRTYPHGVPCWVDSEQQDLEEADRFYGAVFGWRFEDAMPPGAPGHYLIATLDGHDVAALAPGSGEARWNTYIACDDADDTADAVVSAGGTLVSAPQDAGPGGRAATCADPEGAFFRLWQARRRLGAQLVNAPGTWNFSDLHTAAPERALAFYAEVFGWEQDASVGGGMLRLPGYGDHLAATVDPHIHERQAAAPPGFADVVAGWSVTDPGSGWHVRFAVADRDRTVETAERHGAVVLSASDTAWTREAVVRDPQGAELTLSQFTPPG
jgi:predicted enzyme related to lactoylglutathione lyase